MEFNDQSSNIYCDPNAYVLNCPIYCNKPPKKVVFSEPYSTLPNFYINNNFKKGNCACVPKPKPKPHPQNNCTPFGNFNFGGLNEMMGKLFSGGGLNNLFSKIGGGGLGGIISALAGINNLSNQKNEQNSNDTNNILSSLLNNGGLNNILNMFKNNTAKPNLSSTPNNIKDYVIVEE